MKTYTTKEAAEIVGIKERAIQHRCKRDNIRKKDNKYFITDEIISFWITKKEEVNAIQNAKTNAKRNAKKNVAENDKLKERIKELEEELEHYNIADNERIEVFTNEDYAIFEERLLEWRTQQQDLKHKDKMLELTQKSKDEQITFLTSQLEYQRTLANKQLEQLETIFEILQGQNRTLHQLNFINAKDKDYDKK